MTQRVADTRELVRRVLGIGRGVQVVRPGALREQVQAEAKAIVRAGTVSR